MLTLRPRREAGRTRKAKPRTEHILRRTLDLGTAVLLLLLAAPALLCAALAITLTSPGSVFYRQTVASVVNQSEEYSLLMSSADHGPRFFFAPRRTP